MLPIKLGVSSAKVVERKLPSFFFFFSFFFIYSVTGFYYFESQVNKSLELSDAFWWALVTMSTVGYGDVVPQTFYGKFLIAYPTLIFGVASVGYIFSSLAANMFESKVKGYLGMKRFIMKDHIVIVHYNSLNKMLQIIGDLKRDPVTHKKKIILVDDRLQQIPDELNEKGVYFLKGDSSQIETLKKASIEKASHVLVLANVEKHVYSDLEALAIVLKIKEENPHAKLVAECLDPKNIQLLKKSGCESVVCMGSIMGQMIAQEIQDPGVNEVISQLTCNGNPGQFFIVDIPEHCNTVAKIQDLSKGGEFLFIAVQSKDSFSVLPKSDHPLKLGDRAVFIANKRPILQ